MPRKNVHVVPHEGGWAVRVAGNSRVSKTFGTQAQAQAAGRSRARQDRVELLVHRRDGTIGTRSSFGPDPHPPTG